MNHAFPGGTRALVRASYWGGYFDAAAVGLGNRYGPFTPFGFNGAFFYTRLTYSW